MCFHSKQTKEAKKLEHRFNAKFEDRGSFKISMHYNGFQFPKTPVITNTKSKTIEMISWGLIPEWANKNWNRAYTLNARIETLEVKPAFKNYLDNRCIILVDGFYEWQHLGKQKIKYDIGFNDDLFAFAGLYSERNNTKTYTIITTEAQGIMREIHNSKLRMPVALKTDSEIKNWLHNSKINPRSDFSAQPLDPIQQSLF